MLTLAGNCASLLKRDRQLLNILVFKIVIDGRIRLISVGLLRSSNRQLQYSDVAFRIVLMYMRQCVEHEDKSAFTMLDLMVEAIQL